MMKKITSFVVVAFVFAMVMPFVVSAETKNTTVDYTVPEGYEWTVPADVTFSTDNLSYERSVTASHVLIAHGKVFKVAVASANNYKLVYNGSNIAYTVSGIGESSVVLSLASGTNSGSQALTFSTTAENIAAATKAGQHIDTLTFTASVEDAA